MPNWCENKLIVNNPTPEFTAYLKDNSFSFEKIAPPEPPKEKDESGWLTVSAQTAAWGTKWDLDEETQGRVAEELVEYDEVNFDTAWSPPIEAIAALSKMFPEIDFELHYNEPGCAFYGSCEINGGFANDNCCNIESKDDYVKFLVDTMGYDEECAREAAGFEDEEEEEEE